MRGFLIYRGWTLLRLGALVVIALLGAAAFVFHQPLNPVNASLDTLAGISLGERWAHPEMARIRGMGTEGLHYLRRVLGEKESKRTRLLLWLGSKFPVTTNYFSPFPDLDKLEARRWAACQAITQLGPAARAAAHDLVEMLRHADVSTGNQVTMALSALGLDAGIVEDLGEMLEQGGGGAARPQMLYLLAAVQPPAPRARRVLEAALHDPNPWVQEAAASGIARSAVSTPGILARLKEMQAAVTNQSLAFSASEALWVLAKKKDDVWLPTVTLLEKEVPNYDFKPFGGGSGGQGIDAPEMVYLKAGSLWARMELTAEEQQRALAVLNTFCERSERIFMQMMLLPDRIKLGLDLKTAAAVCRAGLSAQEDYYRLQAARLVVGLCDRWHAAVPGRVSVPAMLGHADLGVRVLGARVYWDTQAENRGADVILPLLVDALDSKKHQSYYYPEIQTVALNLLGDMGAEARPALAPLRELENDVNPAVAQRAAATREKVEGTGK